MEFKESVEEFWRIFEENHYEYEQILSKNNYKYVRERLHILAVNIPSIKSIEVSQNPDGTYDVILLGDNRFDGYLNYYVTTFVPANLFPKWNFYYARPPATKSGGFSNEDNIYARITIDEDRIVKLLVYEDLELGEDISKTHIESILKYYLGDIMFFTAINTIEFESEKHKELFLLKDIRNVILDLQELGIVRYVESPFDVYAQFEIDVQDVSFIRDDIYQWSCVVNKPYDAYYNLDEDFFYECADYGVTFGYMFMNADEFSENMELSEVVVTKILEILKTNQGSLYLGTSFGVENVYIDFIILHKTECIDALTYQASELAPYDIYFGTFGNDDDEIILLNG